MGRGGEKPTTAFRVHISVLKMHSKEVFGDLFSIPVPQQQEMYDGLPVVRFDDDEYDISQGALTDTIYNAKYNMPRFMERTVRVLEGIFPHELHRAQMDFEPDLTELCLVIQAAYITGNLALLPASLYMACAASNGVIAPPLESADNILLFKFAMGNVALQKVLPNLYNRLIGQDWNQYCKCNRCYRHWQAFCDAVLAQVTEPEYVESPDPLRILGMLQHHHSMRGACQGCWETCRDLLEWEREKVWNSLPSYFGWPAGLQVSGGTWGPHDRGWYGL